MAVRSHRPVVAPRGAAIAAGLAVAALAACATAARTPADGAPPTARTAPPSATAARGDTTRPRHTAADVRFMHRMLAHHAQALAMTALVPERTTRPDIRLLAERIDVSQRDEIAVMRRWLAERGESVPPADAPQAPHAQHGTGAAAMPGMLSDEEMARLAAATGAAFDRLFLELMIRHHEGAVAMVKELFATGGAGQEAQLFDLASDIDADQRAEIARMRALLNRLPAP